MRIAVSGAHFSGKSTLIASLLKQLPEYTSVDEPYLLLEEEGYEFSYPPSVEDFECQLKYSITAIKKSLHHTIFDRSPLDFLAYALVIAEASSEPIDTDDWLEMMAEVIELLDLIIFIPIEKRIALPSSEDVKLRKKVDEKLQEILLEDSLAILDRIEVIEVTGSLEKRVKIVQSRVSISK